MENEVLLGQEENLAVEVSKSGLTNGQKAGIIVGATLVTFGAVYGVYRLVKFIKAKRTAEAKNSQTENLSNEENN